MFRKGRKRGDYAVFTKLNLFWIGGLVAVGAGPANWLAHWVAAHSANGSNREVNWREEGHYGFLGAIGPSTATGRPAVSAGPLGVREEEFCTSRGAELPLSY